jgi:hypothetical protein
MQESLYRTPNQSVVDAAAAAADAFRAAAAAAAAAAAVATLVWSPAVPSWPIC